MAIFGDAMKQDCVAGYTGLLSAFIKGGVRSEWFQAALIRLWMADRDFKGPTPDVQLADNEKRTKSLFSKVHAGEITPTAFGEAYAAVWARGRPSSYILASIIDLLHHYAYLYSADPAVRSSDPAFFIDEMRLLDIMGVLSEVLMILTHKESV
jgi:hypothetical protein